MFDCIGFSDRFREEIEMPFSRRMIVGGVIGDPTMILVRLSAFQAAFISSISDGEGEAFSLETKVNEVNATTPHIQNINKFMAESGSEGTAQ